MSRAASLPAAYRRMLAVYAVLGLGMWTVPLLSILHVESSAVVATAAYFGAGLSSLSLFRVGFRMGRILFLHAVALLIPWLLLTVSALWQPNCDYARGLLFYLGFPGLAIVFAVTLARLLHVLPVRRKHAWLTGAGVVLVIAPTVYDLGFHPQFYTYNHVFGGFLGPVYDEQLAVRPGLFAFRALTLLWSALFVLASAWIDRSHPSRALRLTTVLVSGCIAAAYAFAPSLGIVTTAERIEDVLGGVRSTRHFDIYYDPARTSEQTLQRFADEHEYRYAELRERLGIDVDERIRSYVYPSAEVKGRLTGARRTNVAPVWLQVPQTHVLAQDFAAVFPHELVHVFSREIGLPVIRASLSVGLVEGLAVALEPPSGRPGPHEQVSAALLAGHLPGASGEPVDDLVDVVAAHLSPFGFWTGRGAVSYTTMGSFVRYLIDAYGPEPFKRAYARAAFEESYGKSPEALAEEWTSYVLSIDAVGRSTADLVAARFAVPSLFEKDCPHYIPPHRRRLIQAQDALADGDSLVAYRSVREAVQMEDRYVPALELWARLALFHGEANEVAERLAAIEQDRSTASLLMRRGDALALLGRADEARQSYDLARSTLLAFAHEAASLLMLRRAVADDASAVRMLVGTADAADFDDPRLAGREAGVAGPTVAARRVAVALALAREDRYEQAIDLLRTTSAASISGLSEHRGDDLVRRRLVWLAGLSYASGRAHDAAAYADSAAIAYRRVGAFSEADVMDDLQAKMVWLAREQVDEIARRFAARPRTWK